jgi:phage-related protein
MADWFAWNGVKCTDYGIHVLSHPAFSRPKERVTTQAVPGRSGTLTILEGDCVYDELIAACECIAPNPASIPAFSAWLHGPGVVMFGNRPTSYYNTRVNNQIDFETVVRGRPHRKFTVNFRCQPFLYLLNMPDIVLTVPGQIVNLGTVFAEPIITVEGTGDIDLTMGDVTLGIAALASSITIDVPQRLAYHEDINLTGSLTGDEWPSLSVGATSVFWTGNVSRITITTNWRTL